MGQVSVVCGAKLTYRMTGTRPEIVRCIVDVCTVSEVQVKLKDGSLRYVNPRIADAHRALMAVSVMNDMGHDVFFTRSDRNIKAYCVPRRRWHETGT